MEKKAREIKQRIEKMKQFRRRGGNMFKALEIRLMDKTGKLSEDIVICALQTIKDPKDARSFFLGYIKDIRRNPDKYHEDMRQEPRESARADILLALRHFLSPKTYKVWRKALKVK